MFKIRPTCESTVLDPAYARALTQETQYASLNMGVPDYAAGVHDLGRQQPQGCEQMRSHSVRPAGSRGKVLLTVLPPHGASKHHYVLTCSMAWSVPAFMVEAALINYCSRAGIGTSVRPSTFPVAAWS